MDENIPKLTKEIIIKHGIDVIIAKDRTGIIELRSYNNRDIKDALSQMVSLFGNIVIVSNRNGFEEKYYVDLSDEMWHSNEYSSDEILDKTADYD